MESRHQRFLPRQLRARPLVCFTAVFILGLVIQRKAALSPAICLAACALSGGAAAVLAARHRRYAAALLLLGFFIGMARMALAMNAFPAVQTQYSVRMVGHVVSEPFTKTDTGRVISEFGLDSVEDAPSDLNLRLYLRGDEEMLKQVRYGQTLALTGHIWSNDDVTNPYEFDFAAYLHRGGMSAMATAKIEDVEIIGEAWDARSALIAARTAIGTRIDALFPRNAGMVRALVLGDRSLLSEEQRENLSATGTAHLIAISGLHVTVLAFALAFLLSRFMPRHRANLIALAPLVFYGALIGFTPSFARALIMFAVLSAAPSVGLFSDPLTRLSLALLICLSVKPLDIDDAGLVLSFTASAGLILLLPPIQALVGTVPYTRRDREAAWRVRWPRRVVTYLSDLFCASLAAQLMTLPAVVAWFGVQSVISLPFNLVCVPLCMAGYVLSMAALLLGAVCLPLGALAARLPDALLTALLAVTRFSRALPVTTVRIGRYPLLLTLLHVAIALAASELSRVRLSVRRFLPLALIAMAGLSTLITWLHAWPFSVTFLDADQADCAVLRTRGHTYVFDAGDTYTPVADYLCATCIHLDGVVLSHPHQDHAGGLSDILTVFKPAAIYVPADWFEPETAPAVAEAIDAAMAMGIPIVELWDGDSVTLSKDCEMTVWSPPAGRSVAEVNDMSLLTLVTRGDDSVLFTGDLTVDGEPDEVPDCDVLKVAHHGADNASSARFLEAASPDIAVICVGENSFGHPGEAALERLNACGATVLRTDQLGAITLTPEDGGWRIQTYLEATDDLE